MAGKKEMFGEHQHAEMLWTAADFSDNTGHVKVQRMPSSLLVSQKESEAEKFMRYLSDIPLEVEEF